MTNRTLFQECVDEVLNEQKKRERDTFMRMHGWKPICEASLNRIMSHGEHGFIVISSQRSGLETWDKNPELSLTNEYIQWLGDRENTEENEKLFLKERNAEAERFLNQQIKQSGYAYSPVHGGYHPDEGYDEYELSYIVYNHKHQKEDYGDFQELFKYALEWCKEFKQESVYVQYPNEAPNYYNMHGEITNSSSSKNFKFNRDNETYFTTTKRKTNKPQRFTADIQFESMYRKGVSERVTRMAREQRGEVVFDDIDIFKRKF